MRSVKKFDYFIDGKGKAVYLYPFGENRYRCIVTPELPGSRPGNLNYDDYQSVFYQGSLEEVIHKIKEAGWIYQGPHLEPVYEKS